MWHCLPTSVKPPPVAWTHARDHLSGTVASFLRGALHSTHSGGPPALRVTPAPPEVTDRSFASVLAAAPQTTALILLNDEVDRCGKTLGEYTQRQLNAFRARVELGHFVQD